MSLVTSYMFPVIKGEYWFVTVYVVLFLLAPFLNKLISALSQKEHKTMLLIMFFVFSVIPTLVFFAGESLGVMSGYSFIWFIFLYLVAAYIRNYEVKVKNIYLILTFVGCSVVTFLAKYLQQAVIKTEYWDFYKYSSVTVFIASLALFVLFVQLKPRYNRLWILLGSTTFGVFLIHTQYIMRDKFLWKELIVPLDYCYQSMGVYLLHMIISVLLIFVVCSVIDMLRALLFDLIAKGIGKINLKTKKG